MHDAAVWRLKGKARVAILKGRAKGRHALVACVVNLHPEVMQVELMQRHARLGTVCKAAHEVDLEALHGHVASAVGIPRDDVGRERLRFAVALRVPVLPSIVHVYFAVA